MVGNIYLCSKDKVGVTCGFYFVNPDNVEYLVLKLQVCMKYVQFVRVYGLI